MWTTTETQLYEAHVSSVHISMQHDSNTWSALHKGNLNAIFNKLEWDLNNLTLVSIVIFLKFQ